MSKSISAGSHGPRSQSKPYGLAFPLLGEGALGVNAQYLKISASGVLAENGESPLPAAWDTNSPPKVDEVEKAKLMHMYSRRDSVPCSKRDSVPFPRESPKRERTTSRSSRCSDKVAYLEFDMNLISEAHPSSREFMISSPRLATPRTGPCSLSSDRRLSPSTPSVRLGGPSIPNKKQEEQVHWSPGGESIVNPVEFVQIVDRNIMGPLPDYPGGSVKPHTLVPISIWNDRPKSIPELKEEVKHLKALQDSVKDQANAQQSSLNHEDSGQPSAPSALPVYTSAAVDPSSFPHNSSAMTVNTAAAGTEDSGLLNDPQADAQSFDAKFVGGDGDGDEKVRMSEHEMPKVFTSSDWIKRGGEASKKENDVVTGPWGGRRWVPKSSRHPRSAQPLRWFRVPHETRNPQRYKKPDISVQGLGGQEAKLRKFFSVEPVQNEDSEKKIPLFRIGKDAIDAGAHGSAGHMNIASSEMNDGPNMKNSLKAVGDWMSSMFLNSIEMHQSLCESLQVQRGTAHAWLTPRKRNSTVSKSLPHSSAIFGLKEVRVTTVQQVTNPQFKFDPQLVRPVASRQFVPPLDLAHVAPVHSAKSKKLGEGAHGGVTEDGVIRHRRVLPAPVSAREETAPNGSSREQAKTARQSREHGGSSSSNTFLTDLDPDLNDDEWTRYPSLHISGGSKQKAQTARGSMREEENDGAGDLGRGNETVRVHGDRQHGVQYDKIRKRNQFLAINASNNTGDNFKPRAKTFGWSGQDFRPSIAALRDATPRRLLRGLYQFDSVQVASLCLSFHTCSNCRAVAAAVKRAVLMVVGNSECILLRRTSDDTVCSYDLFDCAGESSETVVDLGVGLVGSALMSKVAMTWNLLDEHVELDMADSEVGIKDFDEQGGMVFTMPMFRPLLTTGRQPASGALIQEPPFGLFVVQRMFGSFDKAEELEMLNVIAQHASTALLRLEGQLRDSSASSHLQQRYPLLHSALRETPSLFTYDYVT